MSIIARLKRWIPARDKIQSNRFLRVFGRFLNDPHLWHINRHSVPMACSIGLFVAYIPFLGHMLLVTLLAILFRAHLPIALALVWVVNPITAIPLFTFSFYIGALIFGLSLDDFHFNTLESFFELWQPFVVGCIVTGGGLGVLSNVAVRWIWRYKIVKRWQERRLMREQKLSEMMD